MNEAQKGWCRNWLKGAQFPEGMWGQQPEAQTSAKDNGKGGDSIEQGLDWQLCFSLQETIPLKNIFCTVLGRARLVVTNVGYNTAFVDIVKDQKID